MWQRLIRWASGGVMVAFLFAAEGPLLSSPEQSKLRPLGAPYKEVHPGLKKGNVPSKARGMSLIPAQKGRRGRRVSPQHIAPPSNKPAPLTSLRGWEGRPPSTKQVGRRSVRPVVTKVAQPPRRPFDKESYLREHPPVPVQRPENSRIRAIQSLDGNSGIPPAVPEWMSDVPIAPSSERNWAPALTTDINGNWYMAFEVEDDPLYGDYILIYYSTDNGATWIFLGGFYYDAPDTGLYEPAIAATDEFVVVVFTLASPGGADVWGVALDLQGAWSAFPIDADPGEFEFNPAIATDVYDWPGSPWFQVVWSSDGAIWTATLNSDASAFVNNPHEVFPPGQNPLARPEIDYAETAGDFYMTFGEAPLDLYNFWYTGAYWVTRTEDYGDTWDPLTEVDPGFQGDDRNADVAAYGLYAMVVFEDYANAGIYESHTTDGGATWVGAYGVPSSFPPSYLFNPYPRVTASDCSFEASWFETDANGANYRLFHAFTPFDHLGTWSPVQPISDQWLTNFGLVHDLWWNPWPPMLDIGGDVGSAFSLPTDTTEENFDIYFDRNPVQCEVAAFPCPYFSEWEIDTSLSEDFDGDSCWDIVEFCFDIDVDTLDTVWVWLWLEVYFGTDTAYFYTSPFPIFDAQPDTICLGFPSFLLSLEECDSVDFAWYLIEDEADTVCDSVFFYDVPIDQPECCPVFFDGWIDYWVDEDQDSCYEWVEFCFDPDVFVSDTCWAWMLVEAVAGPDTFYFVTDSFPVYDFEYDTLCWGLDYQMFEFDTCTDVDFTWYIFPTSAGYLPNYDPDGWCDTWEFLDIPIEGIGGPPGVCDTLDLQDGIMPPGGSGFKDIVLISHEWVSGIQTTVHYDPAVCVIDSFTLTPNMPPTFQINYNIHPTGDSATVLVYSLAGDSLAPGILPVIRVWQSANPSAVFGDSAYEFLTGSVLADPRANTLCVEGLGGWCVIGCEIGDVNGDGQINVADVVRLVNIILGIPPQPTPVELCAADCNGDGQINVADVVCLVNLILGPGPTKTGELEPGIQAEGTALVALDRDGDRYFVRVSTDLPAAGLQFALQKETGVEIGEVQLAENLGDFRVATHDLGQEYRVVIYSLSGARIPEGVRRVLSFRASGKVELVQAVVADPYAREMEVSIQTGRDLSLPMRVAFYEPVPNPAAGEVTLAFDLPEADRVSLRVYDARGRLVRELVSGVVEAGRHRLRWDLRDERGRKVSRGVYFLTFESSGYRQTRKLLITR